MSRSRSSSVVRLGLLQSEASADPAANLRHTLRLAELAARKGAQIICTQELFRSQYFCQSEDHENFKLAEPIPGPSTRAFCRLARKHKVPTLLDAAADVLPAERLSAYTKMGFDMVAFSGGKALRGPNDTGLLLGRRRLIEAATDLYANRAQAFWRVTFMLSLPGVIAGSLLTFIPAVGDFINADIIGGGNRDVIMIGNVIQFQFITANNYPTAAALGFILVIGVMALVIAYTRAVGAERLTQG